MSTTTPEQWLALAERIEKAMGPDREIDGLIGKACKLLSPSARFTKDDLWLNAYIWTIEDRSEYESFPYVEKYTSSLDIITALIERKFPNSKWAARRLEIGAKAMLDPIPAKDKIETWQVRTAIYADAETPALALCAVFCRAMAERD